MTGEMMASNSDILAAIPEEIQEIGRVAYRLASSLQSGATSLDGEVSSLLSSWKGSAADSYSTAWAEMHTGATKVWDELYELAEKLGITGANYQTQDSRAAGSISSLNLD